MGCKLGAVDKEEVVAEALLLIEKGSSEREALRLVSKKYQITDWRIRGTIHSLVFEIVKRLNLINLLIKNTLEKGSIKKLYPMLINLLRVGVYNLKFTDIPPPKVTKIVVEKVKEYFGVPVSKFANAILRRIEEINLSDYITDSTEIPCLSLKYFHPEWFIKYLIKLIGDSDTKKILQKSLEPDTIFIRINQLKTDIESIIRELKKEEFTFQVDRDLPNVIKIITWKYPIIHSAMYQEGLIYIQEKASVLVPFVVDPQEGDIIFDLCAAPGGKTMQLGQLLKNSGLILAIDRSHRRLLELSTKLVKYAHHNVYIINGVSENTQNFIRIQADKILIDPPCSGTGTFLARPAGKWKLQEKDIKFYSNIQWKLLETAVRLLKKSGEIIYSTCSITLEENERIIKRFLKNFPDFKLVPTIPFIGTPGFLGLSETQRLWPHIHDTEGFFISKLKRT